MNLNNSESNRDSRHYQVVARKYRPQSFDTLIGQEHIATALSNAIHQNRIGHAYLFTGARGVGKTSSARIFAKCLNCQQGPTIHPCNQCDVCEGVSSGEDVDVLEIDGASNRGIDEIRSLRSNAAIRPSRARFKIYIIDEVHMLTTQAFNALLKTLEEPPRHVKFIFCTTDPHKIPITVLSRCQRFDFSPVQTPQIAQSLAAIVESEGVRAEPEALTLLARRANGSMRDSQSLLEQLFSFCEGEITAAHVHQLLGTADMGQVANIATAMIAKDTTSTLTLIHHAALEGIDCGQLAAQLLGYFRDAMAVKANCSLDTLLSCSDSDLPGLTSISSHLSLETLLAILQILDSAIVKMQSSLHARIILEMAAVRVCQLENLDLIADLIKQVSESPAGVISLPQSMQGRSTLASTNSDSLSQKKKGLSESVAVPRPHLGLPSTAEGEAKVMAQPLSVANISSADGGVAMEKPSSVGHAVRPTESRGAAEIPAAPPTPNTLNNRDQTPPLIPSQTNAVAIKKEETASTETHSATLNKKTLSDIEVKKIWGDLIEMIGGVTADLLGQSESVAISPDGRLRVVLDDEYKFKECLKPDRKLKIDETFQQLTGLQTRIDFVLSEKKRKTPTHSSPQLPRAQQMRMLQDHPFVKQAVAIFDAELTNFIPPFKKN